MDCFELLPNGASSSWLHPHKLPWSDPSPLRWSVRKRKLAKREVRQIFDTLEAQSTDYSMKVTFLELYNKEITDLLAPDDNSRSAAVEDMQKKPISLMEDGKGCVVVRGLEEESYEKHGRYIRATRTVGSSAAAARGKEEDKDVDDDADNLRD
ncbi:putative 125 kDa kinesin-related protein [Morus notabilis]|uniref:Putative 125 kDa kinesin-related protein n=1 Tax=Morus notabilis TaxID=981085 RepID=W9QPG6_9ROSA|nr:putative 125 kDa kinesin-related protein [Morus notabilis]